MQRLDLVQLRADFARVDLTNPASIKQWFDTHPYLTTNDHAQVAQRAAHYIRRLKKKANLPKDTRYRVLRPTPTNIPKTVSIEIPVNWKTKEWLSKAIKLYSLNQIAKAVQRNRWVVRNALIRCGVSWEKNHREAVKSKNPCCTHAWCYRHYIELRLSQDDCAELAGVAQQTFSFWLNRFNIPVRTAEGTATVVTTWERAVIYRLRQQAIVRWVRHTPEFVKVRLRSDLTERYWTVPPQKWVNRYFNFQLDSTQIRVGRVPIVHYEYGTDMEGKTGFPAHIALSTADVRKASFLERRLAIHEFARQIVSRGWVWPSYPDEALREDFQRVIDFNIAKYLENGGFRAVQVRARPGGRRVMLHFFDTSHYWEILRRPKVVVKFLTHLLTKKRAKFNFYSLLMLVAANYGTVLYGNVRAVQFPDPMVYRAIFKRLRISGTVLDVVVGVGNRAVACAAAGIAYTTPDPKFQDAVDRGFVEFSGLNYTPYSEVVSPVDVAIYDEGFQPPVMSKVLPYIGKARQLLVFCPPSHKDEVLKYKPRTAIKVRTRFYRKTPGYLFVW